MSYSPGPPCNRESEDGMTMSVQPKLSERISLNLSPSESELQEIGAEVAALESLIAEARSSNERMRDLVRYKRHELFDDGLIDNNEFASLVAETPGSVARLEGYDKIKAERDHLASELAASQKALKRLVPIARDARHENFSDLDGNEDSRTAALKAALAALNSGRSEDDLEKQLLEALKRVLASLQTAYENNPEAFAEFSNEIAGAEFNYARIAAAEAIAKAEGRS